MWYKLYGDTSSDKKDKGFSVISLSDGSFVIAGATSSYGVGSYDAYLLKVSSEGEIIWLRTFGNSGDDYAYSVKETPDKGFIVVGGTEVDGKEGEIFIIKTDSEGKVEGVN